MDALVSNMGLSLLGDTKPGCNGPAAGTVLEGAGGQAGGIPVLQEAKARLRQRGLWHSLCRHLRFTGPHAIFMRGRCQLSAGSHPAAAACLHVLAQQEQRRGWHGLSLTLPKPLLCPERRLLARVPVPA